MLPAKKHRGSPTGGGNFYIFQERTPASSRPRLRFIKWVTAPERAAQWSIDTGYVAVAPGRLGHAGDEEVRRRSCRRRRWRATSCSIRVAEFSTHDNQRVTTRRSNDGLQAALTGSKPPAAGDEGCAARGDAHPEAPLQDVPRRERRD